MSQADLLACALRLAASRIVVPLARTARSFVAREAWQQFGYRGPGPYACQELGRSGRWLTDLAALGDALVRLPGLDSALRGDSDSSPLPRTSALAIARVASPETSAAWITFARSVTVRELLEAARAARRAGSRLPPGADIEAAVERVARKALGTFDAEDDDEDDLVEVRLLVPSAIRAAFDEVVDLYRAVTGQHSPIRACVEAMVGEAAAGLHPPDVSLQPLVEGTAIRTREMTLARDHRRWRYLPEPHGGLIDAESADDPPNGVHAGIAVDVLAAARRAVRSLGRLEENAGQGGPAQLERQLLELIRLEDEIERRLGSLLHHMERSSAWQTLGFDGVGHYGVERLGFRRRTVECRAGIVRALRRLPQVRTAYESGCISLEAAWLLRRTLGAGPVPVDFEKKWVEFAARRSIKRLRDELRLLRLREFDDPVTRIDAAEAAAEAATRTASQLLTDGDTKLGNGIETPREDLPTSFLAERGAALDGTLRRRLFMPASDAAWHASLRRMPGMARERIARLGLRARDPFMADVFLRLRLPADLAGEFLGAVESERQRLTRLVDAVPWDEPWPENRDLPSVLAAREFSVRCRRVPAWVGLLALFEDFARTHDDPRAIPRREWDAIYRRDGYRCMAPACTSRCDIHDHHLVYRSDQGSDEPWNNLCLCAWHHQQGEHGLFAHCSGTAPLDVAWRLGTPELGRWWKNEERIDRPPDS